MVIVEGFIQKDSMRLRMCLNRKMIDAQERCPQDDRLTRMQKTKSAKMNRLAQLMCKTEVRQAITNVADALSFSRAKPIEAAMISKT